MQRLIPGAAQRGLFWIALTLLGAVLVGCQPVPAFSAPPQPTETPLPPTQTAVPSPSPAPSLTPTLPSVHLDRPAEPTAAPASLLEPSPQPTSALVSSLALNPEDWKSWPVVPFVPENARQIYATGLAQGRDPHTFSILGDCQSLSETFLGVYDLDSVVVAGLSPELQVVVANFAGSFSRQSPTIKGGTTAGAVLWASWHEEQFTCQANETPLACELRLHNPSIVIINLGTHYETRNVTYLRKILDELIALGIVPILSTKADNRELDDRLNLEMAQLAVEYELPLWNFYAAVSDLPNNGVGIKPGEEHLGEIYLSAEGLERHRLTALQALAAVWLAVK